MKNDFVNVTKVLAEVNRIKIFKMIISKPGITGKEIIINTKFSQPTVSFHLTKLTDCDLIISKRDGQSHLYYPNYDTIKQLQDRINKFVNEMNNAAKKTK